MGLRIWLIILENLKGFYEMDMVDETPFLYSFVDQSCNEPHLPLTTWRAGKVSRS